MGSTRARLMGLCLASLLASAGCAAPVASTPPPAPPSPTVPTAAPAAAGEPSMHRLAPNAPEDRAVHVSSRQQADALAAAVAPYIAQARASYPEARRRFLAGLPAGHHFFVTTRLHDDQGHFEQVFIAVRSIEKGEIFGVIQSDINVVAGFRLGQPHRFPESELVDWLIALPDGSEEGNVVGKFLDTYHPEP